MTTEPRAVLLFGDVEYRLSLGAVRSLRSALERVAYSPKFVAALEAIELEMLERLEGRERSRFYYLEV